jgi:hypothetical protein
VTLLLQTDKRQLELSDCTLLVWLDETGHEEFADKNFALFGIGGAAILARDYERLLSKPWKELKSNHFGGEGVLLHAADVQKARPTEPQISNLTNFFSNSPFGRIAILVRADASVDPEIETVNLIASLVRDRIDQLVKESFPETQAVVLIFEESNGFYPK